MDAKAKTAEPDNKRGGYGMPSSADGLPPFHNSRRFDRSRPTAPPGDFDLPRCPPSPLLTEQQRLQKRYDDAQHEIVKLQTMVEKHDRVARERRLLVAKLQVELEKRHSDSLAELHRDFKAAQEKVKELQAQFVNQSAQSEAAILEERMAHAKTKQELENAQHTITSKDLALEEEQLAYMTIKAKLDRRTL